jgi:hypothetical protein
MASKMFFIGKYDGPSIQYYIKWTKSKNPLFWVISFNLNLKDDVPIWWNILNYENIKDLLDEEYEKKILYKWFHVIKKDMKRTRYLF